MNFSICSETGDRLLPLAAEEESQFPTLQEVEEMSSQQIKLAHGNRVLPKVDNPIWKADSAGAIVEATASTDTLVADEMLPENDTDDFPDTTPVPTPTQTYIGHKIPEEFLLKAGLIGNETEDSASDIMPLYKLNADGSTCGECLTIS